MALDAQVDRAGFRIPRPALVRRLSKALDAGSVLLVAPAGFGKTIALEETLHERGSRTAWVMCGRGGADPGQLLIGLIESLRSALPGSADVIAERLAGAGASIDAVPLARTLLSELEALLADPLIVVLEDAEHLRGSTGAVSIVRELLAAEIQRLRIAVATRAELPLKVAKLKAAGRLSEFGAGDLAFSAEECAQLLGARRAGEASAADVDATMNATEGWPLGIALGTLAGRESAPAPRLSPQHLFAYLGEEVIDRIEPEMRKRLVVSSLPEELSPPILDAIGLPATFADDVARGGLFLRPIGPAAGSWRYHPLVREYLRARAGTDISLERRRELHRRIANALAAAGRPVAAIEHWLEGEAWEDAVTAMLREGTQILRASPRTVRGWLDRLPAARGTTPEVCLLEGQVQYALGNVQEAEALLVDAIEGFGQAGDADNEWAARFALALTLYAIALDERIIDLATGFDSDQALGVGIAAPATALLAADVMGDHGRFEEAFALADRAVAHPSGAAAKPLYEFVAAHIDWCAGRLDEALTHARASVAGHEQSDPLGQLPHSVIEVAELLLDQGYHDAGLDWLHRGIAVAQRDGSGELIERVWRGDCALAHLRAGRLHDAELELARADPEGVGLGWFGYTGEGVRAALAAARGEAEEAATRAERALDMLQPSSTLDHIVGPCDLAFVLVSAGRAGRSEDVVTEALSYLTTRQGREIGPARAPLLAVRGWVRHVRGDSDGADDDLREFWAEAGSRLPHVLRLHWRRLQPGLWSALERQILEPEAVIGAIDAALPGGEALLPFVDHPHAAVRRAAIPPTLASGHPEAIGELRRFEDDTDARVATVARTALERLKRDPPPLAFTLLGGFKLRRGTWEVRADAWGRPTAARLVRLLLVRRGAAVPEDALFEEFWPRADTEGARRRLQVATSLARKVLDPLGASRTRIEVVDRTYRIVLGEGDRVDAEDFLQAAAAALAESGPSRRALLEGAERIWGGEPLPEDRYEDWSASWRRELEERHVELLGALVVACVAEGDHAATIRAARNLVDIDPVNERAHRELMAAYARSGRTGSALRQYLECRRALVDELGIEPSQETSRLQARILAGEANV